VGSMARGDANEFSDIDLVVVSTKFLPRDAFYSLIPKDVDTVDLSLLVYPRARFDQLYSKGALFIEHVLKEGKVLYDTGYYQDLQSKEFRVSQSRLRFQLLLLRQRLDLYRDISIYNDVFTDCLSHMFSIMKNIAIVGLAIKGVIIFNKEEAINRFCIEYPSLAPHIAQLRGLRPFSLVWSKGIPVELPFSPISCAHRVEDYVRRLHLLIDSVEQGGEEHVRAY
jgi:hypothetical protein